MRAEENPLDPGLALAELLPCEPWAPVDLPLLPISRRGGMAFLPGTEATLGDREAEAASLRSELERAGCAAVKVTDPELARFLEGEGALVRLGDGFAVGAGGYEVASDVLVSECEASGEISLARLPRPPRRGTTRRAASARAVRRRRADPSPR